MIYLGRMASSLSENCFGRRVRRRAKLINRTFSDDADRRGCALGGPDGHEVTLSEVRKVEPLCCLPRETIHGPIYGHFQLLRVTDVVERLARTSHLRVKMTDEWYNKVNWRLHTT